MSAVFSPCRTWRYTLARMWLPSAKGTCLFVGLNPSTADETKDDPTVRRMIRFAMDWGYGGVTVCNIFALRSTDPRKLHDVLRWHAVGPDNDEHLAREAARHELVVAAWGNHGRLHGRGDEVEVILRASGEVFALGVNASGQPKHPLYVRADVALTRL